MDRDVKQRAIRMLRENKGGGKAAYEQMAEVTGHGVRQPCRISDKMDKEGDETSLEHRVACGDRSPT